MTKLDGAAYSAIDHSDFRTTEILAGSGGFSQVVLGDYGLHTGHSVVALTSNRTIKRLNTMTIKTTLTNALIFTAAILSLSCDVVAQTTLTDDSWNFDITVYGYLPTMRGSTTFPNGNAGPNIKINQEDILSHLNFASMSILNVRKGRWGAYADIFYASLSDKVTASHEFEVSNISEPIDMRGDFGLSSQTMLLTMAGTYRLTSESNYKVNMLAGARLNYMSQSLDWRLASPSDPSFNLSGYSKIKERYWDGIIGVAGEWQPISNDPHFFIPFYADIGTGNSHLTSQILAGAGYKFRWGEVSAAWRHIDYQFKSGNLLHSLSFSGPMVGVTFPF